MKKVKHVFKKNDDIQYFRSKIVLCWNKWKTGFCTAEQPPCLRHDKVIEETITLLAHLEKDRQETLVSLRAERELVAVLGQKIDKLAFERMVTLPVAVQKGQYCLYCVQVL